MTILLISLLALSSVVYADIKGNAGSTGATTDRVYRTLSFTLNVKDEKTGESYSLVFPKDDVFNDPNNPTLIIFTSAQIAVAMHNQNNLSYTDAAAKYNTMLRNGVTATVTPKIEIYLQGPPETHLDYITADDQIASKASGFTQTAIDEMHQRFFMDVDNLPPIPIPQPDQGRANIIFTANYPGLSSGKIKSGYELSMNGDAQFKSNPAIGSVVSSGWEAKTELKKVILNSFSGFNIKSQMPLIVGKSVPNMSVFSPSDLIKCNWNVSVPATFTSNSQLFTFNIKPGFTNSYSPKSKNVFYVPANISDGNYNITAGSEVSASTTFYWETSIWFNNSWLVVETPSYTVPATITASSQNVEIKGSMFEDDSTSNQ